MQIGVFRTKFKVELMAQPSQMPQPFLNQVQGEPDSMDILRLVEMLRSQSHAEFFHHRRARFSDQICDDNSPFRSDPQPPIQHVQPSDQLIRSDEIVRYHTH